MDSSQNRRHPRVTVNFYADWGLGPECESYDKVTSLSMSGCFLATQKELRIGESIHIKLPFEARTLRLKGIVRRQLRIMEEMPPTGVGVEFVGISSDDQRKLQEMVNFYV
ncbi:MAG TPA: PilZ domain-containing protein [Pyrinomonadaceae bacterium]|nr:PilZ domain-containing protein [Pyrinomonadaceae bacterium]